MKRERVCLAKRSRSAARARTNDVTVNAVDVALGERPHVIRLTSRTRRIVHGRRHGVSAAQVATLGFTRLMRLLKRASRALGGVAADEGESQTIIPSPTQL